MARRKCVAGRSKADEQGVEACTAERVEEAEERRQEREARKDTDGQARVWNSTGKCVVGRSAKV